MRKYNLVILFLICSLVTIAQKYRTIQEVNVRTGAGKKYETLGVLPKGSLVEILDQKGTWGKMIFNGNEGYVSLKFLEISSTEAGGIKNKSENSINFFAWIIAAILVVGLFIFRNTPVLRFLFKIIKGLFNVVFHEKYSLSLNSNRLKRTKFRCRLCGTISDSTDTGIMCRNGRSHDWRKVPQ